MKILDQRPRSLLPHGKAGICVHAIDLALDIEDRVDPFHGFQGDGRDVMRGFVLAHVARDIGQLEELAPCMAPAERAACRAGMTVSQIEAIVAAIGIGLQNALPACEMLVGVDHLAIARELEQGGR